MIVSLYNDKKLRSTVVGTLVKKGCSEARALDNFSDAIINFIKACYKPDFEIHSNLNNYIVGIAKNLFLREVTNHKKERQVDRILLQENYTDPEIVLLSIDQISPLRTLLDQLDLTCQQVLLLWSQKNRMSEIAHQMNYKSEGMARKKKHLCLRKLYQIVENNKFLKEELRDML